MTPDREKEQRSKAKKAAVVLALIAFGIYLSYVFYLANGLGNG